MFDVSIILFDVCSHFWMTVSQNLHYVTETTRCDKTFSVSEGRHGERSFWVYCSAWDTAKAIWASDVQKAVLADLGCGYILSCGSAY